MTQKCLYPILLAVLSLTACSSGEEPEGKQPPVEPEEEVVVSFSGRLYLMPTKADADGTLEDGVNVTIRTYAASGTPSVAPLAMRAYKADTEGDLQVSGSDGPMLLAAGTYSFYALSVNATGDGAVALPPALAEGSNGETVELKNGTDYLYSAVADRKIVSTTDYKQDIPLSFGHLVSRLQIRIKSEGGDDRITAAEAPVIELPLTNPAGSKITLGAEKPVEQGTPVTGQKDFTSLQSEGSITSGFISGSILLPMKEGQDIPVTITFPSITFNGLAPQSNKIYTLTIKTPAGGFASGNQYNYKVNITGNQIVFTELSVEPWTVKAGNLPDGDVTED